MSDVWVVNASPIIALAQVAHLHLLSHLADEVLIPQDVVNEVLAGEASDPARQAMEGGWGERVGVTEIPKRVLEWGLGSGETAVLAVALKRGSSVAILDDAVARKCAQTLGVPVTGTLGVVVRAKLHGLIPSAREVTRALLDTGLYVDLTTVEQALNAVGERWEP